MARRHELRGISDRSDQRRRRRRADARCRPELLTCLVCPVPDEDFMVDRVKPPVLPNGSARDLNRIEFARVMGS